jgi:hypothetical protein
MAKGNKRIIIVFIFLAVAGLLFFSIGGELLHSHLHNHKDQSSTDNCFISQFQAQVFIMLGVLFFSFLIKISLHAPTPYRIVVIKTHRIIPFSLAPPAVSA